MTIRDLNRDFAQGYRNWGTAIVERAGRVYIGQQSELLRNYPVGDYAPGEITSPIRMRGWPTAYGCTVNGTFGIGLTRDEYEALCEAEGVEPENGPS